MSRISTKKQYRYADTKTQYVGQYIQIRGRYFSGKRFVVGKSRQLEPYPQQTSQSSQLHPWAEKYKGFLKTIQKPKLTIKQHSSSTLRQLSEVTNVFIIRDISTNEIMQIEQSSYKELEKLQHPLYELHSLKLKSGQATAQNHIFNLRQLFSIKDYTITQFVKSVYKI